MSSDTPLEPLPSLANAELAVMEELWQQAPLSARAIREILYPDASRAQHGTVQRLLQRLHDKGYVCRDDAGAVLQFSAQVSREDYVASQMTSLADKLAGGSFAPLLTHLVEKKKITRQEIDKLREMIADSDAGISS